MPGEIQESNLSDLRAAYVDLVAQFPEVSKTGHQQSTATSWPLVACCLLLVACSLFLVPWFLSLGSCLLGLVAWFSFCLAVLCFTTPFSFSSHLALSICAEHGSLSVEAAGREVQGLKGEGVPVCVRMCARA